LGGSATGVAGVSYRIIISPAALTMVQEISDRRIREKIVVAIDRLVEEPDKQGKALTSELQGFRSIRAVGQRYRIIYKVKQETVIVYVVAIGIRRDGDRSDIYSLAKKLFRLNLLEPKD
jgi:mRNA interferase RelE/StbE